MEVSQGVDGEFLTSLKSDNKKSIYNWVDPKDKSGEFKRQSSQFRNWVSNESGSEFPPEKDRYHLCRCEIFSIPGHTADILQMCPTHVHGVSSIKRLERLN